MTHVVTDNCIKCKYTLCVEECSALAIFPEDEVPRDQEHFFAINAELAARWPVLGHIIDPRPDAEDWNGTPDKLKYLDRDRQA